jgi:hypothetical protein
LAYVNFSKRKVIAMFFFKNKKIIVDCFTQFETVFNFYKIDSASRFFPKEIANIDREVEIIDRKTNIPHKISTLKNCDALKSLFRNGVIIPFWTDLICKPESFLKKETNLCLMGSPFVAEPHPKIQFPGVFESSIHLKLISPWKIREKTGAQFLFSSATWNLHKFVDKFVVLPGVVSYNYMTGTNINIFINKNSADFTIEAGQPLVHIYPLTESKIEYKMHLIDGREYEKIGIPKEFSSVMPHRYRRYLDEMRKLRQRQ